MNPTFHKALLLAAVFFFLTAGGAYASAPAIAPDWVANSEDVRAGVEKMAAAMTKWFVVLAAFVTMYCIIKNVGAAGNQTERMSGLVLPIFTLLFTLFIWAPLQNTLDLATYDAADEVWTVSDFGATADYQSMQSLMPQSGGTTLHIWKKPFFLYLDSVKNIYSVIAGDAEALAIQQLNPTNQIGGGQASGGIKRPGYWEIIWKAFTGQLADLELSISQFFIYIIYSILTGVFLLLALIIGFVLDVLVSITMGMRLLFLTFAPIFALFFLPNLHNPGLRDLGKKFILHSVLPVLLYPLGLSFSLWLARAITIILLGSIMQNAGEYNYTGLVAYLVNPKAALLANGDNQAYVIKNLAMLGIGTIVGVIAFWYITKFHFWAVKNTLRNLQGLLSGDLVEVFDMNHQAGSEQGGTTVIAGAKNIAIGAAKGAVMGGTKQAAKAAGLEKLSQK